jgi:hypothetical protein
MYTSGPLCGYVIGTRSSILKALCVKGSVDGYINPTIVTISLTADEDDVSSSSKEEFSIVNSMGLVL